MGLFRKRRTNIDSKNELSLLSNNIANSFRHVKYVNEVLNQKVDHLHTKHEYLKKHHEENLNLIYQWINHFNKLHKEHDKKVTVILEMLQKLKDILEVMSQVDDEYIKSIIDSYVEIPKIDRDQLKKEILEELAITRTTIEKVALQERPSNVTNDNIVKDITRYNVSNVLTSSEKRILSLLFESTVPLSYFDIANKLNMSPNSVKVYINALKNKNYPLEAFSGPGKLKLYAISNKEKIKKFYNYE